MTDYYTPVSQQVTLTVLAGLPASGKSTWAREQHDLTGAVVVSKDALRSMLHQGSAWTHDREAVTVPVYYTAVSALLMRGSNVIADATHLRPRDLVQLHEAARDAVEAAKLRGADLSVRIEVVDFTDVLVGTCIMRDSNRGGRGWNAGVGASRIAEMHDRFVSESTEWRAVAKAIQAEPVE